MFVVFPNLFHSHSPMSEDAAAEKKPKKPRATKSAAESEPVDKKDLPEDDYDGMMCVDVTPASLKAQNAAKTKPRAAKSTASPKSPTPKSKGKKAQPSSSAKSKSKKVKNTEKLKKPSNSSKGPGKKKDKEKKEKKDTVPMEAIPEDLEVELEDEPEDVESQAATEPYVAPAADGVVTRKRKPSVTSTLEAVNFDGSTLKTPSRDAKHTKLEPPAPTVVSPPAATESQESVWPFDCKTKSKFVQFRANTNLQPMLSYSFTWTTKHIQIHNTFQLSMGRVNLFFFFVAILMVIF